MFRYRLPALRRKRILPPENRRFHGMYFQRFSLRHINACWHFLLQPPARAHPYAAGSLFGFGIISGYLYMGASIRVFLQYCNRNFFSIGRLQNTLLFPGSILHIKYPGRYSVCESFPHGCCGRCMGNLFMPGNQLYSGSPYDMDKIRENPGPEKTAAL